MRASVVSFSTLTAAEPATPALLPTEPLAAIEVTSSDDCASTATPAPCAARLARSPTRASTVSLCTRVVLDRPTPALPAPMASEPATGTKSSLPSARTPMRLPASRLAPEPAPPAPFSVLARVVELST